MLKVDKLELKSIVDSNLKKYNVIDMQDLLQVSLILNSFLVKYFVLQYVLLKVLWIV